MSNERSCPTCSGALPPDAPEGACPKCLLAAGFESADGGGSAAAPDLAEVAAQFPELELVEELGRGGMGVVYKARQKRLDRFVALKVLPREIAQNAPDAARFEDRFTREARALARLSHRNIVAVHEFGERDGMYFFLMEYVDGANLRQAMRAGRLSPGEALTIVPQICDALQYAHDQGVVHRDIKPENVLLDQDGNVKIADFGLAKLVTRAADDRTLTHHGLVMGTPHYMAPEQLEKPSEVDHRADIYSLGVVLYEMLTGELPIGRFASPSEKVSVDVRMDAVVLRSLEKEVDRRYQAVSEMKTGIGEVDLSAAAGSGARPDPVRPNSRSSKLAFWGLMLPLVAMVLAVVIGLVSTLFLRQGGMNPGGSSFSVLMLPVGLVGLAVLVGIVLSIAAMVQIKNSDGRLSGMGLAIAGLLLPLLCCLPGALVPVMWMSGGVAPIAGPMIVPYAGVVPLEAIPSESVDSSSTDDLGEVRIEFELDEGEARFSPRRLCILGLGATAGTLNAHMNTSAQPTWPPEAGTLVHLRQLETLRGSGAVHVLLGEERLASNVFTGTSTMPLDLYVRAEHAEFVTVEFEGGDRQKVVLLAHVVRAVVAEEFAPGPGPEPAPPPPVRPPDSVRMGASTITIIVPASGGSAAPRRITLTGDGDTAASVEVRSEGTVRWPLPEEYEFRVNRVELTGNVVLHIGEQRFPPAGVNAGAFSARLSSLAIAAGEEDSVFVEVRAEAAEVMLEGEFVRVGTETDEPR